MPPFDFPATPAPLDTAIAALPGAPDGAEWEVLDDGRVRLWTPDGEVYVSPPKRRGNMARIEFPASTPTETVAFALAVGHCMEARHD